MAVENMPGGGTIITGPADTKTYALVTLAHALAMEINSPNGMQLTRIKAIKAAANHGIVPAGTRGTAKAKRDALKLTVQTIRENWPSYEPGTMVAKALVA